MRNVNQKLRRSTRSTRIQAGSRRRYASSLRSADATASLLFVTARESARVDVRYSSSRIALRNPRSPVPHRAWKQECRSPAEVLPLPQLSSHPSRPVLHSSRYSRYQLSSVHSSRLSCIRTLRSTGLLRSNRRLQALHAAMASKRKGKSVMTETGITSMIAPMHVCNLCAETACARDRRSVTTETRMISTIAPMIAVLLSAETVSGRVAKSATTETRTTTTSARAIAVSQFAATAYVRVQSSAMTETSSITTIVRTPARALTAGMAYGKERKNVMTGTRTILMTARTIVSGLSVVTAFAQVRKSAMTETGLKRMFAAIIVF